MFGQIDCELQCHKDMKHSLVYYNRILYQSWYKQTHIDPNYVAISDIDPLN